MSEQVGDPLPWWPMYVQPYYGYYNAPINREFYDFKIDVPKILKVKKLHPDAILPTKGYLTDTGYDLYALEDIHLDPDQTLKVKTGIAIEFPENYWGKIQGRSSLAREGIDILGGIIDTSYRGEIIVCLHNSNIYCDRNYKKGSRIAQLVIHQLHNFPIEEVTEFSTQTERGDSGFGSTGQ